MSAPDPVAAAGAVFISYSRRDYYFAESLSFQLDAAGVTTWMDTRRLLPGGEWAQQIDAALDAAACVVVVVSPDGMSSTAVHDEYRRALARGARVILAIFRTARIPADLQQAERVDLRGRFGAGVRRLADAVTNRRAAADANRRERRFVSPPWVVAMGVLLVVLWTSFMTLGLLTVGFDELQGWELLIAFAVVHGGVLYFATIAFFRRRMSLTRLAIILSVFTVIFGYPLLEHAGGGSLPRVYPESVVQFAGRQRVLMMTLAALGVSGLIVLAVIRPGDLLRWSPTGRAWPRYRRRAYAASATTPDPGSDRAAVVDVVSDAADAPAADALRSAFGLRPAPSADGPPHVALLVTGRTRVTWVREQLALRPVSLVTFVATGIDASDELRELWRRQWVDARRWLAIERPRDFYPAPARPRPGLPPLPEALTRSVLPATVNLASHLAVSIAALLMTIATTEPNPETPETIVAEGARTAAAGAAMIVGLFWIFIAHGLVVRRDPALVFRRKVRLWGAAAVAATLANVPFFFAVQPSPVRVGISLVAVLALPAAIARLAPRMTAWFPAPVETAGAVLAPGRRWQRTAVILFVHALLWTGVLKPD